MITPAARDFVLRLLLTLTVVGGACTGATGSNSDTNDANGGDNGQGGDDSLGGNAVGGTPGGTGGTVLAGGTGGAPDAGANGGTGAASTRDAGPYTEPNDGAPGTIPVIVAAGWSGLRVGSRDLGKTWAGRTVTTTAINGEYELLRAVTFGEGLFVAVGIERFYSADGITWKKGIKPANLTGDWLSQVAYGHGMFVGVGNGGTVQRSLDGINWELMKNASNKHLRAIAFDGEKFAASGEEFVVYLSTDAVAWTKAPGLSAYQITYCDGGLRDRQACTRQAVQRFGFWWSAGGPQVNVSDDGKTGWKAVYYDTNRFVDSFTSLAFGFVPK